jgi:4-hydroxybenzoate polyprenyltransferase
VAVALGFACLLWGGVPPAAPMRWLGLMLALQQFAISLHNDWCDRDLDAAAKPWRAIPSGAAPARAVRAAAWACAGGSLAAALPLGAPALALDALGIAGGFAYNAGLKRTPLSWLPFALAFPLLPLFGAAALDRWPAGWWSVFVVGLPAILAIHLADSLPDLQVDRAGGAYGLAHTLGPRGAYRASLGALAAAAALGAAWAALTGSLAVLLGTAGGIVALLVVLRWPAAHRVAVTTGAAAVSLGWVAALAGVQGPAG